MQYNYDNQSDLDLGNNITTRQILLRTQKGKMNAGRKEKKETSKRVKARNAGTVRPNFFTTFTKYY